MLRFGTGGVPHSTKILKVNGKTLDARQSGVFAIKQNNLTEMEVEFVYGVNISEPNAIELCKLAKENDIDLTVHAPYYINLGSKEKAKYHASISRIEKTIWAADLIGAKSITFHPAFYQKQAPELVAELVKNALIEILTKSKTEAIISLETTGKGSQWGTLDEILGVAKQVNEKLNRFAVSACIDFAHIHARSNGGMNSYNDFSAILKNITDTLGGKALHNLHIHTSGINYTDKGEKNHLDLEKSDMNYKDLMKALKDNNVSGWLVCESPNLEKDAVLMKEFYSKLS